MAVGARHLFVHVGDSFLCWALCACIRPCERASQRESDHKLADRKLVGHSGGKFAVPCELLPLSWLECSRRSAGTGPDFRAMDSRLERRRDFSDNLVRCAWHADAGKWVRGFRNLGNCGVLAVTGTFATSESRGRLDKR